MKLIILLTFACMLLSLLAGASFLLRDTSQSLRLLRSLTTRVILAALLVAELLIWFLYLQ
ncbi:MAG: DUF2909 family protein [Pseudomonadota bacterium]